MTLHPRKIGFTEEAEYVIAREASRQNMSFSAYVQEAAFARAIYDWSRSGENGAPEYADVLNAAGTFLSKFRDTKPPTSDQPRTSRTERT